MEMIITIFKSLGVDQTVFFQFVSLIIIFILVSNLLFTRLKDVLEMREQKTVKLEGNAHFIYKKADELQEQYKAHVEKTHQENHQNSQNKKNEILKKAQDKINEAEAKFTMEYNSKKTTLLAEIKSNRERSLSEVDNLSKNLIEKLTK
jgi:F-type H+-transporting ATPase subunit b